ncbi:hypothetical protein GCM10027091_74950 [Streptomyces daliensis]
MCPAFPGPDYYGSSAPPGDIGRRWTFPPPPSWLLGGGRTTRAVPVFTDSRSTGEAPDYAPAARRGYAADLHHGLPPGIRDRYGSPPHTQSKCGRAPLPSPYPPDLSWWDA